MSPERDATAYRECTRDPIFLFQFWRWRLIREPEGHLIDDGAVYPLEGYPDVEARTIDELLSMKCAVAWWETESVWLTREEAERYGTTRSYNYPDGWRVYCVCAEGRLGALLREHA